MADTPNGNTPAAAQQPSGHATGSVSLKDMGHPLLRSNFASTVMRVRSTSPPAKRKRASTSTSSRWTRIRAETAAQAAATRALRKPVGKSEDEALLSQLESLHLRSKHTTASTATTSRTS
ncbi:hypothetical protein CF319_g4601 [Tilletia indica]|nr:hypothetical protein CF319_g4601 [Tilletia indica]